MWKNRWRVVGKPSQRVQRRSARSDSLSLENTDEERIEGRSKKVTLAKEFSGNLEGFETIRLGHSLFEIPFRFLHHHDQDQLFLQVIPSASKTDE